ncbi:MAG: hypothetical protein ACHRHE_15370 [Tepidisphaerales bacterium]
MVALALRVDAAFERANLDGFEVGGQIDVWAGDYVKLAVAVEIAHPDAFGTEVADAVRDPHDVVRQFRGRLRRRCGERGRDGDEQRH